jgi:hypothetical protein
MNLCPVNNKPKEFYKAFQKKESIVELPKAGDVNKTRIWEVGNSV